VALADSPGLKAESMRYRARALFMPGPTQDIEAARASYAEGLTLAAEMAAFQSPGILISFYTDWALNEALFGACERIPALRQEFIDGLTRMGASQDAMNTAYVAFTGALRGQTRCPAPM
jgi:predicted membrane-bound mannosyltransferase